MSYALLPRPRSFTLWLYDSLWQRIEIRLATIDVQDRRRGAAPHLRDRDHFGDISTRASRHRLA
jgi:hypothetical protein